MFKLQRLRMCQERRVIFPIDKVFQSLLRPDKSGLSQEGMQILEHIECMMVGVGRNKSRPTIFWLTDRPFLIGRHLESTTDEDDTHIVELVSATRQDGG